MSTSDTHFIVGGVYDRIWTDFGKVNWATEIIRLVQKFDLVSVDSIFKVDLGLKIDSTWAELTVLHLDEVNLISIIDNHY